MLPRQGPGTGHRFVLQPRRHRQHRQGGPAASGVQKVHAIIGGFHLAPAQEPYVQQTVDAIKAINPDYLVPMHCTGRTFTRLADAAMPGKILPPSTGSKFTFGAI